MKTQIFFQLLGKIAKVFFIVAFSMFILMVIVANWYYSDRQNQKADSLNEYSEPSPSVWQMFWSGGMLIFISTPLLLIILILIITMLIVYWKFR